ncbi:MAG: metallophosphoesterase [Sedimentisphaerales bacterium]|nr:metallophosphoesterase [Sedimentisphaerales bacterium]
MFVISDLHIGDQSPKDNLCQGNREAAFHSFLGYVDDQKGRLVILGDFLELLRYPLDGIIARRRPLLDHLTRMDTLYVPGNHDDELTPMIDSGSPPHPFFDRMSRPFVQQIGDKRFKFMHGHEVDPLSNAGIQSVSRMIGTMACLLEFGRGTCILSNDSFTDGLLEIGERMLALWSWLTRRMDDAIRECCSRMSPENATLLARRVRTRRMLERYYQDKAEGLYDVAIVGHTHKAGSCNDWYFNSGSWTGQNNNFLRISPEGRVGVFDWTPHGPLQNSTQVQNQ